MEVARGLIVARAALRAALDLALPRACAACGSTLDRGELEVVCGRCWARLPLLPAPRCERCGHPLRGDTCHWCALLPPYVRAARSVCWAVRGPGLDVVHALKYAGWRAAAAGMAARMGRLSWPRDVLGEQPLLVPVPLAAERERQRGYNQSACLARALAEAWAAEWDAGIACREDVVTRTRRTASQTRLTPADRLRNVSGAFSAPKSARNVLRGAHVVLVDDVVTTAATLNACAAALYDAGARIISFVTFARAPAVGDRC